MNSFLLYILKVSLGLAIISVPYLILLRKDGNLILKRFYLLGGLILAFVFPLIDFNFSSKLVTDIPVFFLNLENPSLETGSAGSSFKDTDTSFSFKYLIFTFYLLGIFILFSRNIFSMISWLKIKKNSVAIQNGVLYSDNNEVFTLFKTIHLPKSVINTESYSSILIHEQAHITQMHFIDLLINELALLLTWINPFTWLITRMIKENHEHLADRAVLLQGVNPARYRAQLLNQTLGLRVFRLGHSFNYSLTKKRFEMMKNKKSKWSGMVKYAFLLPAIILSLGFLSSSKAQEGKVTGIVKFSDTGKPATGAAILLKGTSIGTVANEKGEFELLLTENAELVISYVGYKTALVNCKPGQKIKVVLDPDVINLDIRQNETESSNKIVLKGNGSQAVFIVDGERLEDISNIDPNDIESINVIKDIASIKEKYPEMETGVGVVEIISKKQIEEKPEGELFYIVEEMPKFPGGDKALAGFIYSNLEYPKDALKKKIEGSVLVQFVVNEYGKVESAEIIQSSNSIFDSAALKVFENMPDWSPGKQRGKSVRVSYTAPVYFTLPVSES
ncbi:MAG: TonB family protein [Bacteroidales bacterium]|nr:TonB family protein [Bacteroidales bacterium]MCF8405886.1 TonB family protein [Bacteroidales bacterium]